MPTTGEAASTPGTRWQFGDFDLDLDRHELHHRGRLITVEPQVFDLLAYLVRHHQRVVPRAELLKAVWGQGYGSDESLSTRIKAARHVLGDDGQSQDYIRTVRQRGYRFVPTPVPVDPAGAAAGNEATVDQKIDFVRTHDGARLAYGLTGSGPVLMRSADWMTDLSHDLGSPLWRHWIHELSTTNRLIRYDARGCGLSERDVGPFTFEDWLTDLETVVDALNLGTFPLLGVSQGGAVAAAYAARHPERVSQLILVSSYAQGRLARAGGRGDRALAELDFQLAAAAWGQNDPAFLQVFAAQFLPHGNVDDWHAFGQILLRTTTADNAVRFLEQFAEVDVRADARRVACPTLVLHSRRDRRVPFESARQLAALIPHARLVGLDSDNHLIRSDESAWPALVYEINGFIG